MNLYSKTSIIIVLIIIVTGLLTGGCKNKKPGTDSKVNRPVNIEKHVVFNAVIDWSLSTENEPVKEFAKKLIVESTNLVDRHNIDSFAASRFGEDGWSPENIFSVDFLPLAEEAKSEAGQIFGSINKARSERNKEQRRNQIADGLAKLSPEVLIPPAGAKAARCTDLNGLFKRIASSNNKGLHIYVVATDGHESCTKALKPINDPTTSVALVIALLPEKSQGSVRTMKYEQFEQRVADLSKVVPWAVIIPPFGDLSAAVDEAVEKTKEQKKAKRPDAIQASF